MIVTVTLNAALDVTYAVDHLAPGESHRVQEVRERAGGKGINVARVLHTLGHEVAASGFLGGRTGAAIAEELTRAGVRAEFEPIRGESRRTVAVVTPGLDEATLFNEPGPLVAKEEWSGVQNRLPPLLGDGAVLVLSGSLPRGVPARAYADLAEQSRLAGARVVLDADGDALRAGLDGRPELVKPNVAELGRLLGRPLDAADDAAVLDAADVVRQSGVRTVVVSRGRYGLAVSTPDGTWTARMRTAVSGNPTGAGDAVVAALAAAMSDGTPLPEALCQAAALSAAVVASPVAGEFDAVAYRRFVRETTVELVADRWG